MSTQQSEPADLRARVQAALSDEMLDAFFERGSRVRCDCTQCRLWRIDRALKRESIMAALDRAGLFPAPAPSPLAEENEKLSALLQKREERLEITTLYKVEGDTMIPVPVPPERRDSVPDAVFCRDATITGLEERLRQAEAALAEVRLKPTCAAGHDTVSNCQACSLERERISAAIVESRNGR